MDLEKALIELEKAYSDCSSQNWDGYGAEPIGEVTYQNAKYFLELFPDDIPTPDICPEPSGDIGFEWRKRKGRTFIVGVDKEKTLSYAGLYDGEEVTGTESLGDNIPDKIIDLIKRVYIETINP